MNDFTKEELELILNDVSQCDMEYSRTTQQEELMFKIQSMIENYKKPCEHKWMNMAYAYMQCEKCFVRKGMHE